MLLTPGTKPNFFVLDEGYKSELLKRQVGWNIPGLSEFTFMRTYSRKKPNGKLETWNECVVRVIEGMFSILKTYTKINHIPWDEQKAQKHAQEAADRMFIFKWLPPGRGLWIMGTDYMWERGGLCLYNCAFVSTERMGESEEETVYPFKFLMDVSMVGVGCGFDTKGAKNKVEVKGWDESIEETFVIPDTREGWVEAISRTIEHCIYGKPKLKLDDSLIREEGLPIRGFGGVSSGSLPLLQSAYGIADILNKRRGSHITSTDIVDIQNLIGKCVVAGNVRRSAEIAFGEADDDEYSTMKNWATNATEMGAACPIELFEESALDYELYNQNMYNTSNGISRNIVEKYKHKPWAYKFGGWRWASNNSLFAKEGMDYSKFEHSIKDSGEPGFVWLDLMRNYGRMKDGFNGIDHRVSGTNPCAEQSLESYEVCNLVENFPVYHDDYWDFQRSLKFSYMYAKVVTLMGTHIERTNAIIIRNRRIGCSMSGITDAIAKFGRSAFMNKFCDQGYSYISYLDNKYSDWLGIRNSIKTTSVKPSGSVSLVAGVFGPGIHFTKMKSGYRLIRVATNSELVEILKNANYRVEPSVTDPTKTMVVYFPWLSPENILSEEDTGIWEKFKMAADLQYYWADNQVSCTIEFTKEEADRGEITRCIQAYDGQLKSISLLPKADGVYAQMPFTSAPRKEVDDYIKGLLPLDFSILTHEGEDIGSSLYCDGGVCKMVG